MNRVYSYVTETQKHKLSTKCIFHDIDIDTGKDQAVLPQYLDQCLVITFDVR